MSTNQTSVNSPSWVQALKPRHDVLQLIWRVLRNSWLLAASCLLVLLLVLSSFYLPQLPGQLNEDPLASARWLMTASADYEPGGDLLRGLGLFNLLHSPLLYLLLTLLGVICFVRLGDLLSGALRLRQVTRLLSSPLTPTAGAHSVPLPVPTSQPLYRWRQAQPGAPEAFAAHLRTYLRARVGQVSEATITQATGTQSTGTQSSEIPLTTDTTLPAPQEFRLLAMRHRRWGLLRLLLMVGVLLLWFVIWLILTLGWSVRPPALAPGAEYRYAAHELVLQYQVTEEANTLKPLVAIHVGEGAQGGASATLPATLHGRVQVGPVEVATTPGAPGLLLSTDTSEALLQRPGQSTLVSTLGLTFPNPGSEESVVLPAQAVVLRIVRLIDATNAFTVEVYQGNDKQPGQHFPIRTATRETLKLGDHTLSLRFIPLPSLNIEARYAPGGWLLWLALGCILLGAPGFWQRSAFVLAQIAPWPEQRSVLIVQSDDQREVEEVRRWVEQLTVAGEQ